MSFVIWDLAVIRGPCTSMLLTSVRPAKISLVKISSVSSFVCRRVRVSVSSGKWRIASRLSFLMMQNAVLTVLFSSFHLEISVWEEPEV